jgi:SAM-dependent methyltransferase
MSSDVLDLDPLWRAFAQIRVQEGNLNDQLDLPHVLALAPLGKGRRALDLGCGLGQASFKLAEELGYSVVAVDGDIEMLKRAKSVYSGHQVTWIQSTFESLAFRKDSFDLIIACLSFHFVPNLSQLLKGCAEWLAPGGKLIFSIRHPIRTSNPLGEIGVDGNVGWVVTNYFKQGPRKFSWLGQSCINFHRPLSAYFQMLQDCGLRIDAIVEPTVNEASPHLSAAESQCVPFFLTISAGKEDHPLTSSGGGANGHFGLGSIRK